MTMDGLLNSHKYDDIIRQQHPTSARHPRMDITDRAAQFSPFAALTGYDAAIKETGRLTDVRVELDEDSKMMLDEKIRQIREKLDERPEVTITFFRPDAKKAGGAYVSAAGVIKKLDSCNRRIVLSDGTKIPMEEIFEIDSDIFNHE